MTPRAAPHEVPDALRAPVEAALSVLVDYALAEIVDMVLTHRDGVYEARSADGRVTFGRSADGTYALLEVEGRDPLADQSASKFSPLADEQAHPYPKRHDNAYPHAYEQIAQLFDAAAAPDLCVIHSAAHNWEDQGGHLGEHGSLDVVQARAPFVLAGKGVRSSGFVPRAARLVDIAPTLCALLGCAPVDGDGRYLTTQDGRAIDDVLDPADFSVSD